MKELLVQAKYIGAEQWQGGKTIKYGGRETNPNIHVGGQTVDAIRTNDFKVKYGRDLREADIKHSTDVCILGKDVVDSNKKEDWLAGLILYIKKGGVP